MNPTDFADPLTFPLLSLWGQNFHLLSEMAQNLQSELAQNLEPSRDES